mmetsp:Transcript_30613/g.71774  ORF Transcript_30613/g.71774 Transcript_30613/m.71774 type:complete len:571 (+) Transcript_30613:133-1845(+)
MNPSSVACRMLLLLLLPIFSTATHATTTTIRADTVFDSVVSPQQRALAEDRPCGSIIGRTTRAEILTFVEIAVDRLLTLANLQSAAPAARSVLSNAARYDILAVKVCGSCAESDAISSPSNNGAPTDFPHYPSYCGSDIDGYDTTQSALMLFPIDNETDAVPPGKIRSFVHMHRHKYDATDDAPSNAWPSDIANFLATQTTEVVYQDFVAQFLDGIMPATRGTVTVYPDFRGFGSSTGNRTDFLQRSYLQSGVQSYRAASRFLSNYTGGCSLVDDTIVVSGKDEGAYAAVPLSWAFVALGLRINTLYLSAPILDLQVQTKFMIDSYDQGLVPMDESLDNYYFQKSLPAIAFAASIDTPGYANTGTSETLLSAGWMDPNNSPDNNVIDWFVNPGGELPDDSASLPFPATQVLDETFLERFRSATSDHPCSEVDGSLYPGTEALCQMMSESNVLGLLNSSGTVEGGKYAASTSVCFSDTDTFATNKNVPEYIFDQQHIFKSQLLLSGLLEVTGDHEDALLFCAVSVAFFYVRQVFLVSCHTLSRSRLSHNATVFVDKNNRPLIVHQGMMGPV